MDNITSNSYHITYPITSNITYKNCKPFIRIITNNNVYYGTGKRKSSVARVRLVNGTGKITVNGRGTYYCPKCQR